MMMTSDGGRAAGIEGLFAAGQSLDQKDRWGKTPLFLAAARGDLQLVYYLLEKGAQADIADKQATTPLIVASKQGHTGVVERLLRCVAAAGLALDMRDAAGRTALFWAAHEGKLNVVSCLLGRGARADIPDKQGTLPLMRAAGKGHVDVVRLLLMVTPKAKVDEKDACGKTALSFAVDRGHVEVVHLLTRKGARLELTKNSWADGRGTLLHVAIDDPCMPGIGNRLAMVKALLQRAEGRVLDKRDRRGKTALHCATTNFEGHQLAEVVALLLHKGARADITDNHGMTPLMVASRHSKGRCMVEMLLQKAAPGGLGLDERDRNGMTALHHAVGGAGEVVIKALLRHGASPFIHDNEGRPPNVLQWWHELERERCTSIEHARAIYDAHRQLQDAPPVPLPSWVKTRLARGHAPLPRVEVVRLEPQEQARRTRTLASRWMMVGEADDPSPGEDQHAVLEFVVKQLTRDLFIELMGSF